MKIVRYLSRTNRIEYGELQPDGQVFRITGDLFNRFEVTPDVADLKKLMAPIQPTNILCLGLNYRKHAEESGMSIPHYPVLFMKSTNSIQHPDGPIEIPTHLSSEQVDYEGELAIVIGRTAKNVSRTVAFDYVLGYTCANDVSARDWQITNGGGQWCRGKVFDTFCPLGPVIVTRDDIPNPNTLAIKTILNNELVQDWRTDDMIFDVPAIIEFLSGSTTLLPGTIILTGTPHGVGMAASPPRFLKDGDVVTIEIENIGQLSNRVTLE